MYVDRTARNNPEIKRFWTASYPIYSDWWRQNDVTICCHANKSVNYFCIQITTKVYN